jgi:hypothetical protein
MNRGLLLAFLLALSSVCAKAQMFSPAASALPDGELGQTYIGQVIDFTVPTNATISGEVVVQALSIVYPQTQPVLGFLNIDDQEFPMLVDRTSLIPQGLPSGLSATCDANPCTYIEGASGYLTIAGTPNAAGQFTFDIITLTEGDVDISSITGGVLASFGLPTSLALPAPVPTSLDEEGYTINIQNTNGISEQNDLFGLRLFPNPVSEQTIFEVNSLQPGTMVIEVFSTSGYLVNQFLFPVQIGTNNLELDFASLPTGMYLIKASMDQRQALIKTLKN